jgi:hypothetical protein
MGHFPSMRDKNLSAGVNFRKKEFWKELLKQQKSATFAQ